LNYAVFFHLRAEKENSGVSGAKKIKPVMGFKMRWASIADFALISLFLTV